MKQELLAEIKELVTDILSKQTHSMTANDTSIQSGNPEVPVRLKTLEKIYLYISLSTEYDGSDSGCGGCKGCGGE